MLRTTLTQARIRSQDRFEVLGLARPSGMYQIQINANGDFINYGTLVLSDNKAVLNNSKLADVQFKKATHSLTFGTGKKGIPKGRLFFTKEGEALLGNMTLPNGIRVYVRGHLTEQRFATKRSLKGKNEFLPWKNFTYGSDWKGTGMNRKLTSFFVLGDEDVSDRTAISDISNGVTTINMVSSSVLLGPKDSFDIKVPITGQSFSGTYTDEDGQEYDWAGEPLETGDAKSANAAGPKDFAPEAFMAQEADASGSDLDINDLLSVSSLYVANVKGQTKVIDQAQTQTGRYFQNILIDSLDPQWITDFFGEPVPLPDEVKALKDKYKDFYDATAVMNMGQMIYDSFKSSSNEKPYIDKIDINKLQKAWKDLGKSDSFFKQSNDLYVRGYRDGVADIKPFVDDDPVKWGKLLYQNLISEEHLAQFSVQVASGEFKHVRQQMYEWHTQLLVLNPDDPEAAKDALTKNFGVVVAAQFNNLKWDEDMKPYLAEIIDNMLHGDASGFYDDKMRKEELEKIKADLEALAGTYDNTVKFADDLFAALAYAALKKERDLARTGADAVEHLAEENPGRWARFKAGSGPHIVAAIAYAAGAAFLLYNLITSGGGKTTPKKVISEINLGLLGLASTIKGVEKLMATRLGNWFSEAAEEGASRFTLVAKAVGKWFTEDGLVIENKIARAFLTKSAAEFMAKRLGPALALFGIVMSAWSLADDIKNGDIQDIVFDALNTAFALADAVFIGLDLLSVSWAGPVGLAVAAVGLLVAFIQLLVDIFNPPPPPPDPVEQFVDGPLKEAGYTLAPTT